MLEQFPIWLIVGFVAQFLWVVGILIDKTLLEKYLSDSEEVDSANSLLTISATYSLVIAFLIFIFKGQSIELGQTAAFGLVSGILGGLWASLYLRALDLAESSRVVPIFQTIPIFGLVFAYAFLGEVMSTADIAAIIAIVTGAFILSFNFAKKKFHFFPLILMLVASGAVALQETIFKVGSLETNYWNTSFWMTIGFPVFMIILFIIRPKILREAKILATKKFRKVWFASGFNEIIDNAASLSFVFAITLGPVAVVQSVNAFQPIILLLAATVLAKFTKNSIQEEINTASLIQKILGITIITVGSLILYLNII